MGLEETCNDTAYILGRLFSVLESIQKEANQGINATIKDRYFNSACATPASVFPILFKLENSHIKKLEREKGSGSKIFYEKISIISTEFVFRRTRKIHVGILSSDTKEVWKKGGQINGRGY